MKRKALSLRRRQPTPPMPKVAWILLGTFLLLLLLLVARSIQHHSALIGVVALLAGLYLLASPVVSAHGVSSKDARYLRAGDLDRSFGDKEIGSRRLPATRKRVNRTGFQMKHQHRALSPKGSRRRLRRLRMRDYWSWQLSVGVAAFLVILVWLMAQLSPTHPLP